MDNKRIVLFSAIALLFISPAAAQVGPDVSGVGGALGSVADAGVSFLESYAGLELGDQSALAVFSAVGVLYLTVFVALEKTLEYAGLKDMFVTTSGRGTSQEESNLRLILFSLLFFGVFVGSGWFAPVIMALANSIALSIAVGVGAIIFYSLVAGGGALKGGWLGAKGTAQGAKAAGKEKLADDSKKLAEASEHLNDEKENLQNVKSQLKSVANLEDDVEELLKKEDLEDSAQEIEVIIQKLENLEEVVEASEQDLSQVISNIESMTQGDFQVEEDIETGLSNAFQILEAVREDVENQTLGNHNDYGRLMEGLRDSHRALQEEEGLQPILRKGAQLEKDLEELEELLEEELKFMRGDIKNLSDLEAEADSMAQNLRDREDFQRIENEIQQEKALERRFSDLLNNLKELEEETGRAREMLKELQEADGNHAELVDKVRQEIEVLEEEFSQNGRSIWNGMGIDRDQFIDMTNKVDDIKHELEQVERDIASN